MCPWAEDSSVVATQDAVAGETLAAISERGSEAQIDDLVSRIGSVLRQKLGVADLSAAELVSVKAMRPSNPAGVRLYNEGLAKLRASDVLGARVLLEEAIVADPDYSLAHSALSGAWSGLGFDERARAEASAFELSGSSRGRNAWWWKGATAKRRATSPRRSSCTGRSRISSPTTSNTGSSSPARRVPPARATTPWPPSTCCALPPPASTDPRIDFAEAVAAFSLSDFKRQEAAAERAATVASSRGARLLLANALLRQGTRSACAATRKARQLFERAREIFAATGDRGGTATTLNLIGLVYKQSGDFSRAEEMCTQALAIRREIGNERGTALLLNNIGLVRYQRRDYTAAKAMADEALAAYRKTNDRLGIATALINIGNVLGIQGNRTAARKA
jgi:tetratricopeptide (TPR) repeat protein